MDLKSTSFGTSMDLKSIAAASTTILEEPRMSSSSDSSIFSSSGHLSSHLNLYNVGVYGREQQLVQLRQIYQQCCNSNNKAQWVLVQGDRDGIGRSTFMESLRSSAMMAKGQYCQTTVPFSGILEGLEELTILVSQLTVSARTSILRQLNNDPQVLSSLQQWISNFTTLLMPSNNYNKSTATTASPPLSPNNNNKEDDGSSFERFQSVLCKYLQAISSATPIIFCLEDLHHADSASLQLLQNIMKSTQLSNILFLCSLRTDDASTASASDANSAAAQQLLSLFNTSSISSSNNHIIRLEPLNLDAVTKMLADILMLTTKEEQQRDPKLQLLAQVIHHKTRGNVSYCLLYTIHDDDDDDHNSPARFVSLSVRHRHHTALFDSPIRRNVTRQEVHSL